MLYRQLAIVASVIATCASAEPRATRAANGLRAAPRTGTVTTDRAATIPYDKVVQKSVHNAYSRFEPLLDQLVYHRVRSLELDIHTSKAGEPAPNGDWFVYHEDYPLFRDTSCQHLTDCLGQLAAFHAAVPEHEVVTVFVDLKNDFAKGHEVAELDATIAAVLGRANLVTPGDLVARCPGTTSLRDAVAGRCTFPTLGALRGKFLFVTTGGTACDATSHVRAYLDAGGTRLGFGGPNVDAICPVSALDQRPDVAFVNMSFAAVEQAREVKRRGLVGRVYGTTTSGGLDDVADFATARAAGAVHLATDKVNGEQDLWATAHGARGFPFTCDDCDDELREHAAVVALRATSGDQNGTADSGMYAYEPTTGTSTWTALVSVPSSHVENLAKACLIARQSDAPGAVNVALCRAFDVARPSFQVRATTDGDTFVTDAAPIAGLKDEVPAFLRLEVEPYSAHSAHVAAYVSANGATWQLVSSTDVPAALPLRGIAVSGHGDSVKGLFANLVRSRDGARRPVLAGELTAKAIGVDARGLAYDGVGDPPGAFGIAMR